MNTEGRQPLGNPFPGLRPFREDEEHLFFGRETQVDAMVNKLSLRHFLAVVGASGCGKSSLVNCGLRPALYRGWMPNAGTVWRVAQFRPGLDPMVALAEALAGEGVLYRNFEAPGIGLAALIESELRSSKLGLVNAFTQARLPAGTQLLVVVDQFEELFRYHRAPSAADGTAQGLDQDAKAFVDLLLEVRAHPELPIFVVLTMRSDFLGDCAQLTGLPEAINEGQYLVPRMSRAERRLAIVGPVGVGEATIDPALTMRLVNDVGDNPDQLSVLQHALNRTWALWRRESPDGGPLKLEHYEGVGTVAGALDQHAERAYAELDSERKWQICASVMKALTDWGTDARGVRRPCTFGSLRVLARATAGELTEVLDVFRKPSRSFLMPPAGEALSEQTPIDISHESLMRVWQRLRRWGEEEARSLQMYRRLVDWARRWENSRAELWRGPDLSSASAWRQSEAPSPEWAERFGSRADFDLAMRFLDASETAQQAANAAIESARRAQLRKARRWAAGFGLSTLALLAGLLAYLVAYRWERDAYYHDFAQVMGVPRGIEPLSSEQIRHRTLSTRITTKGWLGPVVRMAVVNSAGQPILGRISTGFEAKSGDAAAREASLEYVYGADGRIAYEVALDRAGQRVRSIVYSPVDARSPRSRNAYLIGKSGSLALQAGSCAAYLRYEYSPEGFLTRTHYLNQIGNATAGKDGVSVLEKTYDAQGRDTSLISRWKDGRPMNDRMGNADMRTTYDARGYRVASEALDAAGAPIDLVKDYPEHWQRVTVGYDAYGNESENVYWDAKGQPGRGQSGCHRARFDYDERGKLLRTTCLDAQGRPTPSYRQTYATVGYAYDSSGRMTSERYFDEAGKPSNGWNGAHQLKYAFDNEENASEFAYFDANGAPVVGTSGFHKQVREFKQGREVRTDHLDQMGKPIALRTGYAAIVRELDGRSNVVLTTYLGVDGRLVMNQETHYAMIRSSYDACNRETESHYLDERGVPVAEGKVSFGIRKLYDDDDNVVEETRLDASGQPLGRALGYARLRRAFDRHRNIIEEQTFDAQGEVWADTDGITRWTRRYDDHAVLTEEAYFGADGKPVEKKTGAARVVWGVGPSGQRTESQFGPDNLLRKTISKFVDKRSRLDAKGQSETTYVGADGRPVLKSETVRFGVAGKPLSRERESARVVSRSDERDHVLEESHLDAEGKAMAKLEKVSLGPDGNPLQIERSYARKTQAFNSAGELTEEAYFDAEGRPAAQDETIVIGPDGKTTTTGTGYARHVRNFDEKNFLIEEAYFRPDGELFVGKEGWARQTYVRDSLGRDVEKAYFGARGEPVIDSTEHFHRGVRVLDEKENMLELTTYGTNGKPLALKRAKGKFACARTVWRYDAKGNQTAETCYDTAGRLLMRTP